jgi:hypothetical protein
MPEIADLPDVDTDSWLEYQKQQAQQFLQTQIDATNFEHQVGQHATDLGAALNPQPAPDQQFQPTPVAPTPDQSQVGQPPSPPPATPPPAADLTQSLPQPPAAPPQPVPPTPAPLQTAMPGVNAPITSDMLNPAAAVPVQPTAPPPPADVPPGVTPPITPDLLNPTPATPPQPTPALGSPTVTAQPGVTGPILPEQLNPSPQIPPAAMAGDVLPAPAPVPPGVTPPITPDQLAPPAPAPTDITGAGVAPGTVSPATTQNGPGPSTPIDNSSRDAFARSFAPYAQYISAATGIDPTLVTAMAGSESNFGNAPGNELFGIKALPGDKSQSLATHEGEYGGTNMNQDFAAYDTPLDSANAYIRLITNHYPGAMGAQTAGDLAHGLKAGGYFTAAEDEYAGSLASIQKQVAPGVQAGSTPGGGYTVPTSADLAAGRVPGGRPSQFSDQTIDKGTAAAICGPAAAIAFVRATGRDPTLAEATQMAQSRGDWDASSGMHGIGSEQDLLNGMGVKSHVTNSVDWNAVQSDVAKGNPVILDTPGHYFVVDGFNPDTGQYHFGTSSSDLIAANHQEWFTPQQAAGLGMGDFRGALYIDNASPAGGVASSVGSSGAASDYGRTGAQQLYMDAQSTATDSASNAMDWLDQQGQNIGSQFSNLGSTASQAATAATDTASQAVRGVGDFSNQFLPQPSQDQSAAASSAGMLPTDNGLPSYAGGVPPTPATSSAAGEGGPSSTSPVDRLQQLKSDIGDAVGNAISQYLGGAGQQATAPAPGGGYTVPTSAAEAQRQQAQQDLLNPSPQTAGGPDPLAAGARQLTDLGPQIGGAAQRLVSEPTQATQDAMAALYAGMAPSPEAEQALRQRTLELEQNAPLQGVPVLGGLAREANVNIGAIPQEAGYVRSIFSNAEANRQAAIEERNPFRDVTGVGGLTNMAAGIFTDPMTAILGGPITGGAEALTERAGLSQPVLKWLAEKGLEGGAWGGVQAGETPDITPQAAALDILEGGVTNIGIAGLAKGAGALVRAGAERVPGGLGGLSELAGRVGGLGAEAPVSPLVGNDTRPVRPSAFDLSGNLDDVPYSPDSLEEGYARVTPERVDSARNDTVDYLAQRLAGEGADPAPYRDLAAQTFDAMTGQLSDSQETFSGLAPEAALHLADTGRFSNKFNYPGSTEDSAAIDAQNIIGRDIIDQTRAGQFNQNELHADTGVGGSPNFFNRIYANETAGPANVSQARPAFHVVFEPDTRRLVTGNHHWGLLHPNEPIHTTGTPDGVQEWMFNSGRPAGSHVEVSPSGGQRVVGYENQGIPIGGGRRAANTNFVVDQSGAPAMRAATLMRSMPNDLVNDIRQGRITDPDQLASVLLRESPTRIQPAMLEARRLATERAAAAGEEPPRPLVPADVNAQLRMAGVRSPTRNESLIYDPNLNDVKALYYVGSRDSLNEPLTNRTGGRLDPRTRLEVMQDVRNQIREQTGKDVPILHKDVTEMAENPSQADRTISTARTLAGPEGTVLSPGRRGIVDRYVKALGGRYPDVGLLSETMAKEATKSPGSVLLDRLRQKDMLTARDAASMLGSKDLPDYLRGATQFLAEQRQKLGAGELTQRDVAKAWLLTLSSMRAKATELEPRPTTTGGVISNYRDRFGGAPREGAISSIGGVKMVRPEDATAEFLDSPAGRAVLDEFQTGHPSEEALNALDAFRAKLGAGQPMMSKQALTTTRSGPPGDFKWTPTDHIGKLPEVTRQINEAGRNGDWAALDKAVQQLRGIGPNKTAFVKHLLGLGNGVTVDSNEINYWLAGVGDLKSVTAKDKELAAMADTLGRAGPSTGVPAYLQSAIQDRFDQIRQMGYGADIPQDAFNHVMHHWLWDTIKGAETTHGVMYDAMRHALMPDQPAHPVDHFDWGQVAQRAGRGAIQGGFAGGYSASQQPNATPWDVARGVGAGAVLGAGEGLGRGYLPGMAPRLAAATERGEFDDIKGKLGDLEDQISNWRSSGMQAPKEILDARNALAARLGSDHPAQASEVASHLQNGELRNGEQIIQQATDAASSNPAVARNYTDANGFDQGQLEQDIRTLNAASADIGAPQWNADGSPANEAARRIPLIESGRAGAPEKPAMPRGFEGRPIEMSPEEQIARMRLDKYPPEVRDALTEVAQRNNWFNEARRGVIPDPVSERMAGDWANSTMLSKLIDQWNPGKAYNAEEIRGLRNAQAQLGLEQMYLQRQAARLSSMPEEEQQALVSRLFTVSDHLDALTQMFEGGRAEMGRGLRALRNDVQPGDMFYRQQDVRAAEQARQDAVQRGATATARADRAARLNGQVRDIQAEADQVEANRGRRAEPLPTELEPGHIEARPGRGYPPATQSLEYRDRLFNNIADAYEELQRFHAMSLDEQDADFRRIQALRGQREPRQLEDPEVLLQQLRREIAQERQISANRGGTTDFQARSAQDRQDAATAANLRAEADSARQRLNDLRGQWAQDSTSVSQAELDRAQLVATRAEDAARRGPMRAPSEAQQRRAQQQGTQAWLAAQEKQARLDAQRSHREATQGFDKTMAARDLQQQQLEEAKGVMALRGMRPADIEKAANAFQDLVKSGAEPVHFAKWWRAYQSDPVGWGQMLNALHYNAMISGFQTIERIFANGALNTLYAGVRDNVLTTHLLTNPSETGAAMKGAWLGWLKGMQQAQETMRHGMNEERMTQEINDNRWTPNLGERIRAGQVSPQFQPVAGGGGRRTEAAARIATGLELPGRVHSSMYDITYQTAYNMEAYRQVAIEAHRLGLKGTDEGNYIADQINAMSDGKRPDLAYNARQYAQTVGFRGDMGRMTEGLTMLGRIPYLGRMIMPFTRVAGNLGARMIDSSPIGLFGTGYDWARTKGAYGGTRTFGDVARLNDEGAVAMGKPLQGVRPFDQRLKDNLIGSSIFGLGLSLAMNGNLSGAGPNDADARRQLEAGGWQPNSARVLGSWVPYRILGQFAAPLTLAANAYEATQYAKPKRGEPAPDAGTIGLDIGRRALNFYLNESMMRDALSVTNGLSDEQRYGNQLATTTAASFIPYGSALADIAESPLPGVGTQTVRGPYTGNLLTDIPYSVGARLPGVASQVPERLDVLGNPIPQRGLNIGGRTLLPSGFTPDIGTYAPPNPMLDEFDKQGVIIRPVGKTATAKNDLSQVDLTPDEQRQMEVDRGRYLQQFAQSSISQPGYQNYSDQAKQAELAKALSAANRQAEQDAWGRAYASDKTRAYSARRVPISVPQAQRIPLRTPAG